VRSAGTDQNRIAHLHFQPFDVFEDGFAFQSGLDGLHGRTWTKAAQDSPFRFGA